MYGLDEPGAPMTNSLMPRPSKSVIGPARIKMPSRGGQAMPSRSKLMPKASLSLRPKALPSYPTQARAGAAQSLLNSLSGSGGGFDRIQ